MAEVLIKEKKQRILDFFSTFEDTKSNNDISETNIEFEVAAFFSETAGRLKLTIENERLKEELKELREQLERSEETYQIRIKNYKEV